jgi:hypothetical protein
MESDTERNACLWRTEQAWLTVTALVCIIIVHELAVVVKVKCTTTTAAAATTTTTTTTATTTTATTPTTAAATTTTKWFIATRNGLDGPGIESRWDEIFRTRPYLPRVPPTLLYNGYRAFTGVKWPGRGVDYPPHLEPRLKKE